MTRTCKNSRTRRSRRRWRRPWLYVAPWPDAYAAIPRRFRRVEAVCWFSEAKDRDWRVDSTTSALGALRAHNPGGSGSSTDVAADLSAVYNAAKA